MGLLVGIIWLSLVIAVTGRACYWPDGKAPNPLLRHIKQSYENNNERLTDNRNPPGELAVGYIACSPDDAHSMCCADNSNSACLSNGLCLWLSDYSIDRGACTDHKWEDDACSSTCKDCKPPALERRMRVVPRSRVERLTSLSAFGWAR